MSDPNERHATLIAILLACLAAGGSRMGHTS